MGQSAKLRKLAEAVVLDNAMAAKDAATEAVAKLLPVTQWLDRSTGVVTISLSNKQNRNALSFETLRLLHDSIQKSYSDPAVRAVILKSEDAPRVFCSGHDLKELRQIQIQEQSQMQNIKNSPQDEEERKKAKFREIFGLCSKVMQALATGPKPTIAQVDGVATAAGCQLVASCDLAYASTNSRFATPGVNIGLFCSTPSVAIGRCVGRKHAMELLLTGQMISAGEAERIGLINRVLPGTSHELEDYVKGVAEHIATKSPDVVSNGKSLFDQQMELRNLDEAYILASDAMVQGLLGPEALEGIDAFLSKRAPSWDMHHS